MNPNTPDLLIGAPCSPSQFLGASVLEMQKVIISYGGGMGGSKEILFVKNAAYHEAGWHILKYLNGHSRKVNREYIVSVEDVRVVQMKYDITAWKNFHKHETDHEEQVEYYLLKTGQNYRRLEKGNGTNQRSVCVTTQIGE